MGLKSRQRLPLPRGALDKASKRAAALAAVFASLAFFSNARAEVFASRYAVRLAGLPVGEAVIHAALEARHYRVAVSADVGVLFINEKVRGEASGGRAGAKLTPEHFWMAMSGTEDSAVDIHFEGSAAKSTKITPPLPEAVLKNLIPLKETHLRGVLDPLSALLTTALRPLSHPCNSVLPIFTGQARFDVSFRPKPASDGQREPTIVTCQVHYVAIAGHSRSGGNGAGTPQNFTMEIGFIRLSRPNLWALQHLSLPTPIGTVTVDRAETAILDS